LFYHAAWFTQPHHKIGFETFLDTLVSMEDVWIVTSWQAIQYLRSLPDKIDPRRLEAFQCKKEVKNISISYFPFFLPSTLLKVMPVGKGSPPFHLY
jgi:hypothetical protein